MPGQANNAYIFPGVGHGLVVSGATKATDGMFHIAAETLAARVGEETVERGCLFPPLAEIREASAAIATQVAQMAYDQDLARKPLPHDVDLADHVRAQMYDPWYPVYV